MEAAFLWVQQVWTFLVSLVPHVTVVPLTHGGVKYVRGRHVRELKAGLNWYWPITTPIETHPIVRQPLRITYQVLRTSDGQTVYVSGLMLYRVTDVVKFCTELWDADTTIDDLCSAAFREVVTSRTLQQLQDNERKTTDNALTRECQKLVGGFGVELEYVRFADFAPCRVLALVHQSPASSQNQQITFAAPS